jgi:hypothetical protein
MRDPLTREVFVPAAVHRFGARGTEPVDNWSRGGLSCEINIDTGMLGKGLRHPSRTGGRMVPYRAHPDTGTIIEGQVVPHWADLIAGVNELMGLFPEFDYVAWDMLATPGGWVVIEGNDAMGVDVLQVHRGLLADPRVRHFVAHHCPKALGPR